MADLQITIKDATNSTKNLLARDNGDATITPYHAEDSAQRTALLAALATLSTASNQTATKSVLDTLTAKVATATNQTTANGFLGDIKTALSGTLTVTGPLTAAQLTTAALATSANQTTANTSLATIATNTTGGSTAARQDEAKAELRAVQGVEAITVGTDGTPRRGLLIVCAGAGDVRIKLADDSQITIPVAVGLSMLPFAVKTVIASGTTATASFWSTL
ncbi:hypothetical protein ACFX59_02475 [Sphingomonas sp. NCPPB 2930]|uniref:spike base protein, RCAP_Rcc01079 family n=1 Tax=Sphingomonas sp. NCPPB 2930 TaxID=3162788 RepID=UPI0036DF0024